MGRARWLLVLVVLVIGGILGAGGILVSLEVNRFTSTDAFCTSCHSMIFVGNDPVFLHSAHRTNNAGVHASCADCHIRRDNWFVETYAHVTSCVRDSIADVDEALWDAHFALHVEAPVFLARDFAAQLPPGSEGNIVNIVDERVLLLSPAYLSYTLSKAALWTATRTLAQSLAPRIRVNAIGPGPTLPHKGQTPAQFDASLAGAPLGRGTTPDEVADVLMFLLRAPAMTGQMLALDGGRHMRWPEKSGPTPRI